MNSVAVSVPANENDLDPNPKYGISEWPDTVSLYERLAALVRQPIRPIRRENMDTVLNYFQKNAPLLCVSRKKPPGSSREACSITSHSITHFRWHLPRPEAPISPTSMATATSTFSRLGDRYCSARMTRRCENTSTSCWIPAGQLRASYMNTKSNWPSLFARPCPLSRCSGCLVQEQRL